MANGTARVSSNAQMAAGEVADTLESRDLQGIAIIGASLAGGLLIANEVAARVRNALGYSDNTLAGDAVSAGTKLVLALGAGVAAGSLSGIPLVAVAFIALAHVGSAAVDVIAAFQRTSVGTNSLSSPRSGSPTPAQSTPKKTRSPDPSASPTQNGTADKTKDSATLTV